MRMILPAALVLFAVAVVLESQAANPPTLAEAEDFMNKAEARLSTLSVAANQANSQLSTGPTSPEGKAKISHSALKTGLIRPHRPPAIG